MEELRNLKVGDSVAICNRSYKIPTRVKEIRAKYIRVEHKNRLFDINNGVERGTSGVNSSYIKPITIEEEAEIMRECNTRYIINMIKNTDWEKVSYENLCKIYEIMKEIIKDIKRY